MKTICLAHKLKLEPHENTWISIATDSLNRNKQYCFESTGPNRQIICYDSLLGTNDESGYQNIHNKLKDKSQVYIFLQNSSNKCVHINKNAQIGILYKVRDILEPSKNENFCQIMKTCENVSKFNIQPQDNMQQYICNYIQASEETLQKRKEDLTINDFKL